MSYEESAEWHSDRRISLFITELLSKESPMVAKVQRWGNSQGLRLSKQVLESADISVGDDVEVIPQEGQIIIRKVSKRRFDLAEMVARMPRDYQVHEESFGKPAGREAW